eukprot:4697078-Prymnesium_polylepis.2
MPCGVIEHCPKSRWNCVELPRKSYDHSYASTRAPNPKPKSDHPKRLTLSGQCPAAWDTDRVR